MTELLAGLSLGLGAGITPGPLMTLVVTSSLERGFGAGARVAIAPLLTDGPIVALSVAFVSSVSSGVVRLMGIGGGLVVVVVGVATMRRSRAEPVRGGGGADIWRGVLVNITSPHPWIFWIGVGAPLLVAAWRDSTAYGLAFLGGFYVLLVGSKVVMASVAGRAGRTVTAEWRTRLVVVGGLLLIAGGVLLVWEAAAGRL